MVSGPVTLLKVSPELASNLAAARRGDRPAFGRLVEPHRRELRAYCYRMSGSVQEAEDLVQETFLRAWQRLNTFEERGSLRAWLYKIATNICLDALERHRRRIWSPSKYPPADPTLPLAPPPSEPDWLEPFPDELVADDAASPEARYTARESITFAFLTALQLLPPRQRAILILRDVLDWHATEVAEQLDLTLSAVNSALHRARATLARHYSSSAGTGRYEPPDPTTRTLLDRYLRAWEAADIGDLVRLLKEEAAFPMPPSPSWYRGRAAIRSFLASTILAGDARGRWRLMPTRANGLPAFGFYRLDPKTGHYQAFALHVVEVDDGLVASATTFPLPGLFPLFNLPVELDPA